MPVFDGTISGIGQDILASSQQVQFALWHADPIGPSVRVVDMANPDYMLRLGWISFAHVGFEIDAAGGIYWDKPIWLDFANGRWHPDSQTVGGSAAGIFAGAIRWALSPGTIVHLFVGP